MSLEPDTLAKERFQPLRCLGQGGTGMVYEALDREQNARVALKLLHAVSPDALLRFKNEFRSMRGLSHPNLVTLGELIEDSGRWFFTMEYVPGADLLSWVRRGRKTMQADPPTVELRRPSENGAKTPQPRPMRLRFDGARLRSAFAQVVAGLCALHAAGKVHRDIKPSNILVTETGRVVILDFGLVIDVVRPAHVTREDHIVGTAHYMSPEQASAKTIGPATDWYAAGVILYQALTGRLPFSGSDIDVLGAKRRNDPLPPRSVTPDVPEDLDELCCALLARDPLLRPGDAEMLERFSPGKREPTPQPPSVVPAAPFVGRARELAELRAAFAETRYGSAVTVYLIGESGIGKSALARELSDLLAREQGALCLSGACYDRESVPYKAVDGLIDSLSRHLCELERAQVNELLPPLAALLPRVFPVLRRVEAIAQAPMPTTHGYLEPKELRAQAFGALRELLRRIALRRPLVLAIDDLQWTDSDSLALLGELLRPPGEPNVLFIGTLREAPEDGPLETAPLKPSERRHIRLERLPPSDARMLTQLLIGRVAPARPVNVEAITREGAGHPLFLDELVRHFTADSTPEVRPVKLEDALWSRVEKLDPGARRIVELVSMAGGRLQQETVTQAAQMDYADFSRQVAALRAANLVRTTAARRSDTIEPFHDRVRAAVLANLDEEDRRERHERLALALEASGDAEARVVHWRGAGRPERAAGAAIEAAAAAEQALAFDRAARLYRLVLELGMPVGADPHAITVRLGDALANAGRGQSAAQIYLRAAEDATPAEAHELRHRAGVELMASGRIDQALEVFQQLMDASGIKLARSSRGALLGAAFRIVQLRLRGIGFKERASSQIPASDLQRIDLGYRLASGLAVDPVRGVHVQARHLLHALRAGDPQRIALALSGEALSLSSPNWQPKRVDRVLGEARRIAARLQDQRRTFAIVEAAAGVATYLQGRWKHARALFEQEGSLLRENYPGVAWERANAQVFFFRSLYQLGDLGALARQLPDARREALALGNLFGLAQLPAGMLTIDALASDDPDHARALSAEALQRWSYKGMHVTHFSNLLGEIQIDLYTGQPAQALERVRINLPALEAAGMMRVQLCRVHLRDALGRTALAAVIAGVGDSRALLAQAKRNARALEREKSPWALAHAQLIRAGIAHVRGRRAEALDYYYAATASFERADMTLQAIVARCRRGELEGDETGLRARAAAEEWMRGQSIRGPQRMLAMLAPAP